MFYTHISKYHGIGLFAAKDLRANTFYDVGIDKTYKIRKQVEKDKYLLDYFIDPSLETLFCISDNKLTSLLTRDIDPLFFHKKYALISSNFMRSNDGGWPATCEASYNANCDTYNNAEFILNFHDDQGRQKLTGICLLLTKDVHANEEILTTYGWSFWFDSKNQS